jgi:CheY-like chemotaxis protein
MFAILYAFSTHKLVKCKIEDLLAGAFFVCRSEVDFMTDNETRRIQIDDVEFAKPRHGTGPLDFLIPWVIELRIMGTPQVLQIKISEHLVLGRDTDQDDAAPEIDLRPFNAHYLGVSRRHALLTARNSRVTIRDLDSSNGTFVNGGRLEPGQEYRLRHGDHLTLGKLMMQVSFVLVPSSSETSEEPYKDVTIPKIGSGQNVLLVDDDKRMIETISYVLERAGFNVRAVGTTLEAIQSMESGPADIVVMELMLPDRTGLDIVNYLRTRDDGTYTPIIIVSSITGGYQKGQAIEAGVDVFLSKPVGVDELMRSFNEVMAGIQ